MRSDAPSRVATAAMFQVVMGFIFDAPFRLFGGGSPRMFRSRPATGHAACQRASNDRNQRTHSELLELAGSPGDPETVTPRHAPDTPASHTASQLRGPSCR